jgi:hypothetical protein
MFRLLLPTGLQKSSGKLGVIAIGPKGGQIVGYAHGDMKKPIYAGSAAAAKLAQAQGHKGEAAAGTFGLAEWLDALTSNYGLAVQHHAGDAATITSPTTPHAIVLAQASMPGAHFGALQETASGWAATATFKPGTKDEAAAGGKQSLVHQGGLKPPGWPDSVPPPGTVIKRSAGGHTYLLTISAGADGKTPRYLVTAPPGAPLFAFTSTAQGGIVKGTIGHPDLSVTVAFDTHTAAAVAIVGPKVSAEGVGQIKCTSGPNWWGWWAEAGKTAPISTAAGQDTPPDWLAKQPETGVLTPDAALSSGVFGKVWPSGVAPASPAPADLPPPEPVADLPPAPESLSPPAKPWPDGAAPVGGSHTFGLHGHQVSVEVVDAGVAPGYVVTVPSDPADVGHFYGSLEDLKLHLDAVAGGEPESDGSLPTFLTGEQIQAALGGAPAPAEEPAAPAAPEPEPAVPSPPSPEPPPAAGPAAHPGWSKLPSGVSHGFSSQKALKPGKAPENKGKLAVLTVVSGADGAPKYQVTLPEGGALYNDPDTGKLMPAPKVLAPGESATFSSSTTAAEALMNAPSTGFIFWGMKPGKSGKLEAVVLPPAAPPPSAPPVPPPAEASPITTPEPTPEPEPEIPAAPAPPAKKKSKKKAAVEPPAAATAKPSGWAAWLAKHPGTATSEWLDEAPAGTAIPAVGGGHVWKSVAGGWVDTSGAPASPDLTSATPDGIAAAEGVGPDGMKHATGTKFVWASTSKTAGSELYNDLLKAFPGAIMEANTQTAKGVPLPPNVYKVQFPLTLLPSSVDASDKAAVKAYVEGVVLPLLPKYGFKPFTKELCNHVGGTNAFANITGDADAIVAVETSMQAIPPAATGTNAHMLHDEAMFSAGTPWHGHGIDLDGGLIRDQYASVTKRKGGAREVRFKLTPWGAAAVGAKLAGAPAGAWDLGGGNFDPKAGEVDAIGLVHHTTPTKVLSGPGWTAHFSTDSTWAMQHAVKVDVEPGNPVAAAMAELAEQLGMPQIAVPPGDEDREHMKLRKLLWNVSPKKHNELFGKLGDTPSPPPSSADLRVALKAAGLPLEQIDKAEVVSIGSGHRTVRIQDGQSFIDKGIHGLYHNWYSSDAKDLARKLASGGNVATAQRWKTGMGGYGQSSPSDMASGGADYVFHYAFRADKDSAFSGLSAGHGLHIVTGAETLERADWHSCPHDNYGSTINDSFSDRKPRATALNTHKAGSGEVMVQNQVALDDIRAIVCNTAKKRQDAISEFKSLGVHTIGGRPVEEVVVTSHAEAGALVKASWAATIQARSQP